MSTYKKIPKNLFDTIITDVGVIVKSFNPANPGVFNPDDIVTATTGGITLNIKPTYSDRFSDVDNAPENTKQGKHLDNFEVTLATTILSFNKDNIKTAIGAADISANKIAPKIDLSLDDFEDELWWVCDKANGGFVACCLKNVLSTDGFSLATTKNGKGTSSVTFMAHYDVETPDEVPVEFYVVEPSDVQTVSEQAEG